MKKMLRGVAISVILVIAAIFLNIVPKPEKQAKNSKPRDLVINTAQPSDSGYIHVYENGEVIFSYSGQIDMINDGRNGNQIEIKVEIEEGK